MVEDTSSIRYRALEITTEIKQNLQIQSVLNFLAPAHIDKGVKSISEVGAINTANYVILPTSRSDDLHYFTLMQLLEHHEMSVNAILL